jgi:enediyne biosynthesis protein E4
VRVEWPDGRVSARARVPAGQRLTMRQAEAVAAPPAAPEPAAPLLAEVTAETGIDFAHRENDFVDFERERLAPKLLSTEGPPLAVGDVNGDGLDDLFVGGAKEQAGALYVQQANGRFLRTNAALLELDAISEDVGAAFLDADGDRDLDLYVVSGGSEYSEMAPALQDRLYLNDGRGTFRKAADALPAEDASGSRVAAADFDGDGDVDLFVGGRGVPGHYGRDPRSLLLQNDGRGHFADVTERLAPELARVGMVTDAAWRDVTGDGRPDLVVVGEWMPITLFRNAGGGRLVRQATPGLEKSHGWWNRVLVGDFTGDGRVDVLVGNLGLNARLRATEREPTTLYVKDFDRNGFDEQIVACYDGGASYPIVLRDELVASLPYLKARYPSHKAYAGQRVTDVFSAAELAGAVRKEAYTFATALARGNADGSYTLVPLPPEAQLAPVYALLADDVDGDGKSDLLLAGNFEGVEPKIGALMASDGLVLRGDGRGGLAPVRGARSGFRVPGAARDLARLRTRRGALYVVARNGDRPLAFRPAAHD